MPMRLTPHVNVPVCVDGVLCHVDVRWTVVNITFSLHSNLNEAVPIRWMVMLVHDAFLVSFVMPLVVTYEEPHCLLGGHCIWESIALISGKTRTMSSFVGDTIFIFCDFFMNLFQVG